MSFRYSLRLLTAVLSVSAFCAQARAQDAPLPGQEDGSVAPPAQAETITPPPAETTNTEPVEPPPPSVPDMPERPPIPAPPAVTLPPPANATFAKPPLAWRTKAYKLNAGDSARPGALRVQHIYESSLRDTLNAIVTACKESGFSMTSANFAGGHLLATDAKGTSQIIFSARQVATPNGRRTLVKVALAPEKDKDLAQSVDALLSRAETILASNGLL